MDELNNQKLIAVVALGLVFLMFTVLIGLQVYQHQDPNAFVVGAWGLLAGQYMKLLGVDQGASVANRTIASINGAASQNVVDNTAALNANTAAQPKQ